MFLIIVLLVVTAVTGTVVNAKVPVSPLSLEVRIQDYADVPGGVWKISSATAARVFKRAGVRILWLNCSPDDPKRDEQCRDRPSPEARVLRILPPEMTAKTRAPGIEFGRAQLTPDGSRGTYASVYWGRVQKLASGGARSVSLGRDSTSARLKEARILGYVLAHELAHLFGVHHSKAGVMHGPWTPSELAALLQGSLRFQAREEERIRESLAAGISR